MKTITQITNVYDFSELSPAAKAKARDWYREGDTDSGFGAECVINDAKMVFAHCGITIDRVGYSGFWSQGDGAHFVGIVARGGRNAGRDETGSPDGRGIAPHCGGV